MRLSTKILIPSFVLLALLVAGAAAMTVHLRNLDQTLRTGLERAQEQREMARRIGRDFAGLQGDLLAYQVESQPPQYEAILRAEREFAARLDDHSRQAQDPEAAALIAELVRQEAAGRSARHEFMDALQAGDPARVQDGLARCLALRARTEAVLADLDARATAGLESEVARIGEEHVGHLRLAVAAILAAALLVIATLVLTRNTVSRRLERFAATVRGIDAERPPADAVRAFAADRDEIGELARVFDDLLARIAAGQDRAAALNDELGEHNRALSEARTLLEHIYEAAPSGLLMVDSQGIMVRVNGQMEHLFGYARAEMLGQPVEMLVPEGARAGHAGWRAAFGPGERPRAMGQGRHVLARRKDDSEFYAEIGLNPTRLFGEHFVVASIIDITGRKALEDALAEKTTQAEQASQRKGDFLAGAGRELRAALAPLVDIAGALADGSGGEFDHWQSARASSLRESGGTLLALLDEILEIVDIERGAVRLQPESCPVASLVAGLRQRFEPRAASRGLAFAIAVDPAVPDGIDTDRQRLQQLLDMLVANALEAIDGGAVELSILPGTVGGAPGLLFSVPDPGRGTGRGLVLCRELASLLGGVLAPAGAAGQVNRLALCLPIAWPGSEGEPGAGAMPPPAPLAPLRSAAGRSGSGPASRVLVVDDQEDNLILVEAMLKGIDCELVKARSGEEALQRLGEGDFALVLLDVFMPDMDGIEVARRMGEEAPTRRVPIVFLSATAIGSLTILHGYRAGAVDFLHKPIEPEILRAKVSAYLELDHLRRQLHREIAERTRAEEYARHLADHDALTGLPNRRALHGTFPQVLARAQRHDRSGALLFVDLDRFKAVNDSAGHEVGDLLLIEIGQRLVQQVRGSDMVCRLGGDEFLIMLQEITHTEDAAVVAENILNALSLPAQLAGFDVAVTPSVGISIFPRDGSDVETLIRKADAAMYEVKRGGRASYRFYLGGRHPAAD